MGKPSRAFLMPSPEELALAREGAAKLPPFAHVQPYRVDLGEGELLYCMVLAYHDARHIVERDYPFVDVSELVDLMGAFMAELRYQQADNWVIARGDERWET